MSLKDIAGSVSAITNGSNLGNKISTSLFGNSSFLRNEERSVDKSVSGIEQAVNIASDIGNALGIKNNMYKIGEIPADFAKVQGSGWWGTRAANAVNSMVGTTVTALSYWFNNDGYQQGVIIDGFDNFKGDINVALPDNPVIYHTAVTDNIVRNPNRLTMRVYVDLMHSDDLVQNLKQQAIDAFGSIGQIALAGLGHQMNRAQQALSSLQWIQENGRPFKVYTPHKVYDNMMIERIQPVNDQKMNEILAADITFKEIVFATSLGDADKSTARTPPTKAASEFASVVGWVK